MICQAVLNKDTNLFTRMCPSYQIHFRENVIHGQKVDDGGTTPKWNNEHTITSETGSGSVNIMFMNDNDFIGEMDIDFSDLLQLDDHGEWLNLDKGMGKCLIRVLRKTYPIAQIYGGKVIVKG